jgi:hypothetical protein
MLTGFYVGYAPVSADIPSKSQQFREVVVVSSDPIPDFFSTNLTNLERSTQYSIYVKAFNSKGSGPASQVIFVKTLDEVPLNTPVLIMESFSRDSITVSWSTESDAQDIKYILHYKQLNSSQPLKEVPITSSSTSSTASNIHTLNNLSCGASYEMFVTAFKAHSKSQPSIPLIVKTSGSIPTNIRKEQLLKRIASHEVLVNLNPWTSLECPITDLTIRVKAKASKEWINVFDKHSTTSFSGIFSETESLFPIKNLSPQTSYFIDIIAKNSAGGTKLQYDFNTKSLGETFFTLFQLILLLGLFITGILLQRIFYSSIASLDSLWSLVLTLADFFDVRDFIVVVVYCIVFVDRSGHESLTCSVVSGFLSFLCHLFLWFLSCFSSILQILFRPRRWNDSGHHLPLDSLHQTSFASLVLICIQVFQAFDAPIQEDHNSNRNNFLYHISSKKESRKNSSVNESVS